MSPHHQHADRLQPLWWLAPATLFGCRVPLTMAAFRELLTTDDPQFAEELHKNVFNTIQGVTTCTQFGVAAIPMGIWLFFRGHRKAIWAIGGLIGLAVLRAIIFSERLAVMELIV